MKERPTEENTPRIKIKILSEDLPYEIFSGDLYGISKYVNDLINSGKWEGIEINGVF